jgi:hypothetical protein
MNTEKDNLQPGDNQLLEKAMLEEKLKYQTA